MAWILIKYCQISKNPLKNIFFLIFMACSFENYSADCSYFQLITVTMCIGTLEPLKMQLHRQTFFVVFMFLVTELICCEFVLNMI